ncbi:hypothetical protein K9M59_01965 [Candidatus Gracilibacteria bacterium]|nr:hypothetical protein [Candidatus Gracilibacteria bacterium]MCF7819614.1 hypothetical protein [Candidatus Gracilibacteria bacterium]
MKNFLSFGFVLVSALFLFGCNQVSSIPSPEAQQKVENFVNTHLLGGQGALTIKEFTSEKGLYKFVANANGQEITSYMTKDATFLFPQVINMETYAEEKAAQAEAAQKTQQEKLASIPKTEIPTVELFVMSHCPFGTQIEKGMLPVLDTLGDKVAFELKFVNYAMHQKKEIDEQLVQYCLQKEEPQKLISYLSCFLEAGEGGKCLAEVEIDTDAIETCVAETDEEFGIMADYEDKSTWRGNFPTFAVHDTENQEYGVQGSPTLVINGETVQSARDPKSLLQAVCAGFETQPEECNTDLPSDTPSSGFGYGTSATDSAAAQCG